MVFVVYSSFNHSFFFLKNIITYCLGLQLRLMSLVMEALEQRILGLIRFLLMRALSPISIMDWAYQTSLLKSLK